MGVELVNQIDSTILKGNAICTQDATTRLVLDTLPRAPQTMKQHRRRVRSNLARLRHQPALAMFALHVLVGLVTGYNGEEGGVGAAPPSLHNYADRALAAAFKDVPTVKVTVGGEDRSMAEVNSTTAVFSPEWEVQYRTGQEPGCDVGRGSFQMTKCGLGSNINSESGMG